MSLVSTENLYLEEPFVRHSVLDKGVIPLFAFILHFACFIPWNCAMHELTVALPCYFVNVGNLHFFFFFVLSALQESAPSHAHGASAASGLLAPTSWRATSARTPGRRSFPAPCAASASCGRITWPSTPGGIRTSGHTCWLRDAGLTGRTRWGTARTTRCPPLPKPASLFTNFLSFPSFFFFNSRLIDLHMLPGLSIAPALFAFRRG